MRKMKAVLLGLALLFAAGTSEALPVSVDGTIANVFDDAGACIGHTIDYVNFDVAAGTTLGFNIRAYELDWNSFPPIPVDLNGDGNICQLDTMILLFDGDGNFVDYSDDSLEPQAYADGSVDSVDSYLLHTFTSGGNFTLYISTFWLNVADIARGYNDDGWETRGTYRLSFEVDGQMSNLRQGTLGSPQPSVVPEPATMSLVGLGLGGMALRRLRRRG